MSMEEAVGFIGLGNMGMGMARNLVAARYDVLAYDMAAAPLEQVVAQGGCSRSLVRRSPAHQCLACAVASPPY